MAEEMTTPAPIVEEAPREEGKLLLHWLMVSYVSPGAKDWIERVGGRVLPVSSEPPLIAVGIAYHPEGCWKWRGGHQEKVQGLQFWSSGEIQEPYTDINLIYKPIHDRWVVAEYCSADDTYLILPDEEFDRETRAVKPQQEIKEEEAQEEGRAPQQEYTSFLDDDNYDDLDDHPF